MLDQLIFVGFASQVVALDRTTGRLHWNWRSPAGKGFPTVLLDGELLIVSVMGYTYCLDPLTGRELWRNELKGMGIGVASIASVRGCANNTSAAAAAEDQQANNSAG